MGIKEKLIQAAQYKNNVKSTDKSAGTTSSKKISSNKDISKILSGDKTAKSSAAKLTETQKKGNVWTNLKEGLTFKGGENAVSNLYDVNPLELQKAQGINLNAKEMYQSDLTNKYNRLDKNNSIFGKMSVDNNKDVLIGMNEESEYGSSAFASKYISSKSAQSTLTLNGNNANVNNSDIVAQYQKEQIGKAAMVSQNDVATAKKGAVKAQGTERNADREANEAENDEASAARESRSTQNSVTSKIKKNDRDLKQGDNIFSKAKNNNEKDQLSGTMQEDQSKEVPKSETSSQQTQSTQPQASIQEDISSQQEAAIQKVQEGETKQAENQEQADMFFSEKAE